MAINKYAAIRHRIIDQKIGNQYQPYPTKEALRQACEEALYGSTSGNHISDSTIEKDLQYIKMEYDAPVKFSRSHNGYYYSEDGYSIDLNAEQIEAIKMAANVLSQFKNSEIFAGFHSAIDKILDRVNISPDIQDKAIQQYVQFETAPIIKGTEYLGQLLQAIKNKVGVKIGYRKFQTETETKRSINPYLLKEYRNRWYVIGFDTDDNFVKTYA
ncbi:MAG: WYL domain-containing protein, partial [Flavobacteriales bacterium]|nr:WYL domain-containing protein [Flavobacteriales bacterium]